MILHMLLDYGSLRIIWWVLLGVLLIGFAIMDGFDLGVAILLPFLGRNDVERRIIINTIGPVWEGNQVWLILGGGAIFAAWPAVYAVSFSGFYIAMALVVFSLILRPVGFKYRSMKESKTWRHCWDCGLFVSGFVPSLILGVAVGNVLQGVPFHFNEDLRMFYDGNFLGLLNPFSFLCGFLSVSMFLMHASAWLMIKTEGMLAVRASRFGLISSVITFILFSLGGFVVWFFIDGYKITSPIIFDAPSNPLLKEVEVSQGVWFANYIQYPFFVIFPILGLSGALLSFNFIKRNYSTLAFISSSVSLFGIITTVGVSIYPFILPSSNDFHSGLTIWDASSSHLTLFVMLGVTVFFMPIIIAYTTWVYYVLRGKVTEETIKDNNNHSY
ncbi:cytochrome d ubiquinol oxidase subunit II [Liberibacter crescens]|uniref:cytochrome d ubiquinol oxidase subunit II n=1 Tax=Liberibacter crescens TaxID=1273132 RepID=UPI000762F31E|nr:cytochrome d ubiquinol oxidase subunit II [Liberibacter crescens]AMC12409.1 cytochrome d ubiquinol oxidase subunit 2 [Liberibacter crescens]